MVPHDAHDLYEAAVKRPYQLDFALAIVPAQIGLRHGCGRPSDSEAQETGQARGQIQIFFDGQERSQNVSRIVTVLENRGCESLALPGIQPRVGQSQ